MGKTSLKRDVGFEGAAKSHRYELRAPVKPGLPASNLGVVHHWCIEKKLCGT